MRTEALPAVALLLTGTLFANTQVRAQASVPTTYDVSTVKAVAGPAKGGMGLNWRNGALKADNVTLGWLLTVAFHARADQVSGAPSWAKEKHFDITAKLTDADPTAVEKMSADEFRTLLLSLLVERFGLTYHAETKEMLTYDLVPAKGGLKLTPAADSGDKNKEVYGACSGCIYSTSHGLKAHDIAMTTFMEFLTGQLGRSVHDGTGWTSKIDVNLNWAPDLGAQPGTDEDADLLPLPQALEKQMGLHLSPTRGPVKLFVVDHLDEPSAN